MGLLDGVDSRADEWEATLTRFAQSLGQNRTTLEAELASMWVDRIEFKAPTAESDSIALDQGHLLVQTAFTSVRTTATTALGQRARINGRYSVGGERVVQSVRLAHTRPGSFVVPVLYRLDRDLVTRAAEAEELLQLHEVAERVESQQRRASRTLVQALEAVQRLLVDPERTPGKGAVEASIMAGVSRELVTAITQYLELPHGRDLVTSPHWAGGLRPPVRTPAEITLERDAAPRLRAVATMFETERSPKFRYVTGQIIDVGRVDPDTRGPAAGIVKLWAPHRGVMRRIECRTGRGQWSDVSNWLETGEAVVAYGSILATPRGLQLDLAAPLEPLEDTLLFQPEATNGGPLGDAPQ